MLAASREGVTLFRNNTGMAWQGENFGSAGGILKLRNPRPVRFGLCEGSADLIGWTEKTIQNEDVGKKIAVFTAIEIKAGKTRTTDKQKNFIERVQKSGGIGEIKHV